MIGFSRGIAAGGRRCDGTFGAFGAQAQENLDANKTPAQLYAADCAICHKTPQGMTKSSGMFGLADFLREHYTASREAAAAIAAYVQAVDKGPAPPAKKPAGKRTAKGNEKGDEKGKPGEPKAKPGEQGGRKQIQRAEGRRRQIRRDQARRGQGYRQQAD